MATPSEVSDDTLDEHITRLATSVGARQIAPGNLDSDKIAWGIKFEKLARVLVPDKSSAFILIPVHIGNHFIFLGMRVHEGKSCYVILGTHMRGLTIPPEVGTLISHLEVRTGIKSIDLTPEAKLKQQVHNGCSGYVLAFAEWFVQNFRDGVPSILPPIEMGPIHNQAQTMTDLMRQDDALMKRG